MKKTGVMLALLMALLAFGSNSAVRAETLTSIVPLTTAAEIDPPAPLPTGATGTTVLTVVVNRDAMGNITGGTVNFKTTFRFPGAVTITGHHIHEGAATANGPVVINPSLSGSTTMFESGEGMIDINATVTNVELLGRLLANPAAFYVNLHTSTNQAGAIRGQIVNFNEILAVTVAMSTAGEVPPITDLTASGTGTITIELTRNSAGEVIGGTVTFTIDLDFPGRVEFTGLHIHEGPPDMNGPVVINTGLSNTNRFITEDGTGVINIPVAVTGGNPLAALRRLLDNPTNFYVNLHSTTHQGGIIRAQLFALSPVPPVIYQASAYTLPADGMLRTVMLDGARFDAGTAILINGQLAMTGIDPDTNQLSVTIPPNLTAEEGILYLQARQDDGLRSLPVAVAVVSEDNMNGVAATAVDAARFSPMISPDSISAIFGTNLATQEETASQIPLPLTLDGTTVYVNGYQARLFYVSPGQINFSVPGGTLPGEATIVVINSDGGVSTGTVMITQVVPGIFTTRADGTGAPAALASSDGMNFDVVLGNPDGTTVEIDPGSFVMLFGTGLRYGSQAATLTIDGVEVPATFMGAQGTFVGLDQVNFQIPQSLAGRGEVDLVLSVDGKAANTVRVRIK